MERFATAHRSGRRSVVPEGRTTARTFRLGSLALLLAIALPAQVQDFGKAYSFEQRRPVTQVERTIDALLPSLVKVHGASGLATIEPFATGVIVSKEGHVLTLDQIMLQPGRTRVVLFDGSVHQAEVLPPDAKLGVRLLKIYRAGSRRWPVPAAAAAEPGAGGVPLRAVRGVDRQLLPARGVLREAQCDVRGRGRPRQHGAALPHERAPRTTAT